MSFNDSVYRYYLRSGEISGVPESGIRNDNAAYSGDTSATDADFFSSSASQVEQMSALSNSSVRLHSNPKVAAGTATNTATTNVAAAAVAHDHTDTYEQPLPPEALGARQLVDYVFAPPTPGRPPCVLSPSTVKLQPRAREIGWPLPLATERVCSTTGRRLVYLSKGQPPLSVLAEPKRRFVAVSFKPLIPSRQNSMGLPCNTTGHGSSSGAGVAPPATPATGGSGASGSSGGPATSPGVVASASPTSYGTVLGYSDDNTDIIWHDRSERFASRISLCNILTIHRASAMQCKHCGLVLLKPELREHMTTHKKGSGVDYGVFTDDSELGMLCGDSGLIQNLVSPRRLGEGAQGVVDLMKVVLPTAEEEARAGAGSCTYRYVSAHLSPHNKLTEVVLKTMRFDCDSEALAQYQQSVRFMTVMEHPHLVEYLAVQLLPGNRAVRLCMPYYKEGDVATLIRNFRGDHFEESFVCSIALQLSLALAFLHERNPPIVHGDIKAENVMFYNNRQQIVLMDLDASCEVRGGNQNMVKSSIGTTAYMAPETLNDERLMPSSDMWSLGVFLYVLTVLPDFPMILNPVSGNLDLLSADSWATEEDLQGMEVYFASSLRLSKPVVQAAKQPNRGMTLGDCIRANVQRKGYSAELTQLIVNLLSYNPLRRPSATEVGSRLTEIMTNCLLSS